MNYSEIESNLAETIQSLSKENNWVNLTKVGISLRKKGVRYVKLTKLLQNFMHLIELKEEEGVYPPVYYVRLK